MCIVISNNQHRKVNFLRLFLRNLSIHFFKMYILNISGPLIGILSLKVTEPYIFESYES